MKGKKTYIAAGLMALLGVTDGLVKLLGEKDLAWGDLYPAAIAIFFAGIGAFGRMALADLKKEVKP